MSDTSRMLTRPPTDRWSSPPSALPSSPLLRTTEPSSSMHRSESEESVRRVVPSCRPQISDQIRSGVGGDSPQQKLISKILSIYNFTRIEKYAFVCKLTTSRMEVNLKRTTLIHFNRITFWLYFGKILRLCLNDSSLFNEVLKDFYH